MSAGRESYDSDLVLIVSVFVCKRADDSYSAQTVGKRDRMLVGLYSVGEDKGGNAASVELLCNLDALVLIGKPGVSAAGNDKYGSLRVFYYIGLKLGHLPLGKWRRLSEAEVNMLKKIGTGKKSSAEKSRSIMKNASKQKRR